jgi:methionyl-tRNA formyltransferase
LPAEKINRVTSVNDDRCLDLLRALKPGLVIVNGTRIISERILNGVSCQFINMHAGITPKYRGVHGAYWALAKGDRANCGVTIHFVDPGIDTGLVIAQQSIPVGPEDNFVTYPLLQVATGIPLMKKAVDNILSKKIIPILAAQESHLWTHPTLGQYLYYRLKQGIK